MKYMEMRQKCISSHFSRFFDVKMTSTDSLISCSAHLSTTVNNNNNSSSLVNVSLTVVLLIISL